MSYAINPTQNGWRSINSQEDLMPGETYSEAQPVLQPNIADLKSAAIKNVRVMRIPVFATLAGIQSQALANADTDTAKAISGLQDKLKALPDIDVSKCTTQSDIDAAFVAGWMAIVAAAPANVASAFNGVLS
jgi:hypothetical protein